MEKCDRTHFAFCHVHNVLLVLVAGGASKCGVVLFVLVKDMQIPPGYMVFNMTG